MNRAPSYWRDVVAPIALLVAAWLVAYAVSVHAYLCGGAAPAREAAPVASASSAPSTCR